MNRKQLIGIGAGVVALIAVVVAVLFMTIWSKPAKADYKAAQAQLNTISKSVNTSNQALTKYSDAALAAGDKVNNLDQAQKMTAPQAAAFTKAVAQTKNDVARLKDMKVMHDAAVKERFNLFDAQAQKMFAYQEGIISSFLLFRQASNACYDIYDVASISLTPDAIAKNHREAATDSLKDLDLLAKSDSIPLASYGKSFAAIVRDRQATFDGVASKKLSTEDGSAAIRAANERYKKLDPLGELKKQSTSFNIHTPYVALKKLVDERVKMAK
jgi:hypothetical protein